MKNKVLMEVTMEEKELIEAIRNHNRAFPNGHRQLSWYAQNLFDDLIEQ